MQSDIRKHCVTLQVHRPLGASSTELCPSSNSSIDQAIAISLLEYATPTPPFDRRIHFIGRNPFHAADRAVTDGGSRNPFAVIAQ